MSITRRGVLFATGAVLLSRTGIAGTIDQRQVEYLWIPRIYGQNQETGTYMHIPAGGIQFATGISSPNPVGNWFPLYLPADFPQVVLINRAILALASSTPNGIPNEFTVEVDPGGAYYASAGGAEAGGNFIRETTIAAGVPKWDGTGGLFIYKRKFPLSVPILFDRTAGDKIEVTIGASMPFDWISVRFGYLRANTFQPT